MRKPHIYPADALPQPLNVIGESVTVLGAGDATKKFEVHLMKGNKGGGPPPHHHPWDEAFYVLHGKVELRVGDETHIVSAGSFAQIPGGMIHAYTNLADGTTLLDISSDNRSGELFAALSAAQCGIPDDLGEIDTINKQFGSVFAVDGDSR